MIRKVWHPVWVANTITVELANGTWKVQVDYSSLNKVCANDMYPFPEEGEGLAWIMGYSYKCFLRIPKEYSQIRMTEDDEEKTGFHTEERVYSFTHMPKELKNLAATLHRMMEKEAKGSIVKKFFGQGEQVQETLDANEGGTFNLNKKLQEKSTPTPRAWRLYLGKETIEEGSGVGIILVSPEERKHSYAIRLKFNTFDHAIDCEALLAGLAASVSKGVKDLHVFMDSPKLVAQIKGNHTPATGQERKYKREIMDATALFHRFRITHLPKNLNSKAEVLTGLATIKLEFLNQKVSVAIKTRPSVEETSSSKKGKAASNVPGAKPSYNWETSGSN
ncbi:reverse transcriptase domain-containing protein [Tanacetum coccineum]